jgi:hypothetical protein
MTRGAAYQATERTLPHHAVLLYRVGGSAGQLDSRCGVPSRGVGALVALDDLDEEVHQVGVELGARFGPKFGDDLVL